MRPAAKHTRLTHEASAHFRIACEIQVKTLQRDIATKRNITCAIHDAHSAFTDHRLDAINRKRCSFLQTHRRKIADHRSTENARTKKILRRPRRHGT
jgi:hypothetical protein